MFVIHLIFEFVMLYNNINYKGNFVEIKQILSTSNQLSEDQIENIVEDIKNNRLSTKQILAFAKRLQTSCSDMEVYYLAKHMAQSGQMLNLSEAVGFCVDKHSAGNVSDGMSIILMSVLASLGIKFVKSVSDTYGVHGNLLQKLNRFRGFCCAIDKDELIQKSSYCGVGLIKDDGQIAPVASKIYTICKQHDMLSEPIVSASIMANKIATGANMVVVDVKSGEGSVGDFSNVLAKRVVEVGKLAGIKTVAVITDFNWPISASVGVGLELLEIKDTLSSAKEYVGSNTLELAKEMTVCALMSCGMAKGRSEAVDLFNHAISSGKAYNKFCEIIETYGGEVYSIQRENKLIDTAVSFITADYDGYVGDIKLDKLYKNTSFIISNKGEFDQNAGLVLMCAEGNKVEKGQKLAKVFYSHDNNRYFKVAQDLFEAFEITKNKPNKTNLFIEVVI